MNYKLPPLPETPETFRVIVKHGKEPFRQDLYTAEQMQAYAIAAIEAQGVPDGYAGAAAFTNVMPTVAIHFSTTEQALSFIDKIRASWDRQQRSTASAPPAPQAEPAGACATCGALQDEQIIKQAEPVQQEPVAWLHPYGGVLQTRTTGYEKENYTIPLHSDEQLKQLLAAEYNRGWDDCEATHDGP